MLGVCSLCSFRTAVGGTPVSPELVPRILVVDDEPSIRKVLARFLRKKGCEAVEAGDGQQALAALREQAFDLVLSDVDKSPVDGQRLWELVRAEGLRAPPFLFVSALGPPPAAGERSPVVGFVPKPFTLGQVWAAVAAALNLPE